MSETRFTTTHHVITTAADFARLVRDTAAKPMIIRMTDQMLKMSMDDASVYGRICVFGSKRKPRFDISGFWSSTSEAEPLESRTTSPSAPLISRGNQAYNVALNACL